MASPYTKKHKWPSQKKEAGADVADFVPYISNIVNTFRKTPRPKAPKLTDPVTGTTISLADAKRQVSDATRAADLSTENLDAQTGAAIRVGNLGNKFRSLSELNSKEAMINAQMGNQTKMINANIDSQNSAITNQYRDDLVNAEIAQQREQSQNLSNAADKFVTQRAVKDQYALDKEKTNIMSKMYNSGVYQRLMDSINGTTTTPFVGTQGTAPPLATPTVTSVTQPAPVASSIQEPVTGPLTSKAQTSEVLPSFMRRRTNPRYYMNKFAAGGMMKVFSGDPKEPVPVENLNYKANQTDRDARFVDGMTNLIGKGLDPYTSNEGKSIVRHEAATFYNPQFASDLGVRLKAFQTNPEYQTMTPEQRISTFYSQAKGDSELDQFLKKTSSFGGNPAAFYQRSKLRKSYGGKMIKPFA